MGKSSIEVDLSKLKRVQEFFETASKKSLTQQKCVQVGNAMVSEMKDLISKGTSPIRGQGRYRPYKQSYVNTFTSKPGKKQRPVNLEVSGDFIQALRAQVAGENQVKIGYKGRKEQLKEQGHREGANDQASRPTIPVGSEQFAVSVQRAGEDRAEQFIQEYVDREAGKV